MPHIEFKTPQQSNINWGETFRMAVKAPAIADRVFDTYEHANGYVKDLSSSAIAGLLVTVNDDPAPEKNGVYLVKANGPRDLYLSRIDNISDFSQKRNKVSFVSNYAVKNGEPVLTFNQFVSEDGSIRIDESTWAYQPLHNEAEPILFDVVWYEYNDIPLWQPSTTYAAGSTVQDDHGLIFQAKVQTQAPLDDETAWDNTGNMVNSFPTLETLEQVLGTPTADHPAYVRYDGAEYHHLLKNTQNLNIEVAAPPATKIVLGDASNPYEELDMARPLKTAIVEPVPMSQAAGESQRDGMWDFRYVQVDPEEYLPHIEFNIMDSLPANPDWSSKLFVAIPNGGLLSYYRKSDMLMGGFRYKFPNLYEQPIIDGTQEVQLSRYYFCNGIFYEIFRGLDETLYFGQKILIDTDNLQLSISILEQMIYDLNAGIYLANS